MPRPRSKLGTNPLTRTRGLGALLPTEPEQDQPDEKSAASTQEVSSASGRRRMRRKKPRNKPLSLLVNKITEDERSAEIHDLKRHTFYLTEAQIKKVKLFGVLHNLQISEVIRMLVDEHLRVEI